MDVIAFIKARLDETEEAAKNASPSPWTIGPAGRALGDELAILSGDTEIVGSGYEGGGVWWAPDAEHIARNDPARVLREVATWRQILLEYSIPPGTDAVYGGTERETGFRLALSFAIKAKALEWKDHPDYREWES